MMVKRLAGLVVALVVVWIAYHRLFRQPVLTWGATPEEAARSLPGDELLEDADVVATRAITIDASPAVVWPWLVQMGPAPRGGAYTYDWIENLFGLNMRSADRILPEYQHIARGDLLAGAKGGPRMRAEIVEPERILSWRSEDGTWVWTFVLVEDADMTRLISRNRIALGSSLGGKLAMLLMEPGSLVTERKMLLGIRERTERLAASQRSETSPAS